MGGRFSKGRTDRHHPLPYMHLPWDVLREGGSMLHDRNGQSVVEYIVILAILISLVGGALWEIFSTLRVKFNDVNTEIGS